MAESAARYSAFLRDPGDATRTEALSIPGWQPADWATLFAYAEPVEVLRGKVLIEKDARERALYFVASGLLEVTSILGGMAMAAIAKVRPGSVVGELAFLDGQPRSAKVWAIADSELYRLQFAAYETFADEHARSACDLLLALGRVVSMRLRNTLAQRSRA